MEKIWGSAIVLLLVFISQCRAKIQQLVSTEALEGAELNITCSHPSASRDNIFWYQQFPNGGPELIVTGFSETAHSPDPEGTLHISNDEENSTFALRGVWLADAAVYYCARRDTVGHQGQPPYNRPHLHCVPGQSRDPAAGHRRRCGGSRAELHLLSPLNQDE
ncbi:unnamed protein product [Natator depressus]